ncbi:hypothetical protein FA15DRAFT_683597 [Coprinopsis marcescibilis]|uniref:Uncharacterized protein n=1 Tax=Coprinopsis marcescibilis TaxID=230819 RepID=A0A5C3KB12_COPMA|nr:hypothetical protein FA15DRAFT_683597 [Coprinopsis marcescibilis]
MAAVLTPVSLEILWPETLALGQQTYQPHDEPQQDQIGLKHYFGPKRYYCVEAICYACGVVKAWAKFAKSESPTKILKFLAAVFPTKEERPDFICIDKAYLVLQTAISNGSWNEWKEKSRFIVDTYHHNNHKESDELYCKWCNPAPMDGSQPNLVIIAIDAEGRPYLKRAFNTQMTANNLNWMIHVMLYYHTLTLNKEDEDEDKQEEEA